LIVCICFSGCNNNTDEINNLRAELEKMQLEKISEDNRIAEEKRIEDERIAEEIKREEERIAEEKRIEEERILFETQYEEDILYTCANMRVAGLACGLIHSMVSSVWSAAIKNTYKDFDTEIKNLYEMEYFKQAIETLKKIDDDLMNHMIKLQNPPEKYKEAYNTTLDMYEIYIQLSEQAQSPSGSLLTFNSTCNDLSSRFTSIYARVKVLLPKVEEKINDIDNII
jgi:hypothetical protein